MARIYDHTTKEWVNVTSANGVSIKDLTNSFDGAVNVEQALQHVAKNIAEGKNEIVEVVNTLSEHTEKIDWLMANGGGGGGGAGGSAPTLTSSFVNSSIVFDKGSDVVLPLYFLSPNLGDGVLMVTVNDIEWDSYPIKQGNNNINIGVLPNLSNRVSVYAKDRVGRLTNSLDWDIICGGIDLTLDFNYNVDYEVSTPIYMPFTINNPNNAPTTLYLTIDGDEQQIPCIQGYNEYVFKNLGVGVHKITLQAKDDTFKSALIVFNLVVLDSNSLFVSTTFEKGSDIEYGVPVVIDYRISNPTEEIMIINQYLDGELHKTLQAKRGAYSWTLNNLPVKDGYNFRIEVIAQSTTMNIEGQFNIIHGNYNPVLTNTQGLVYRLDASERTNQDLDKENPVYEGIQATLNGFNFTSDGWIDGSLKCTSASHVEIDYMPWKDNAVNGSTIEIVFKTENTGNDLAKILYYKDTYTKKGIYIGYDEAKINSLANEGKVFLDTSEWTTVSFVLDRKDKFAKIYINGICTRAFSLTDSGSGMEAILEDFVVNNKIYLNCDNNLENSGSLYVRDLRIYRRALTSDEIVSNVIAQEHDLRKQKELYDFNFNNTSLPVMRMYGDTKNMTLETAVPMRIKYTSPNTEKYGQPFDLPYCEVYWQGTSSLDYVLKNYNIRLKDGDKADAFYTPYPNGVEENLFCLKADYMESSHSRSVGIYNFVNQCMYDTKNPAQLKDNKVRNCVEGFPIVLYINDELQGVYNFNTDRFSNNSFGYNDPDKHLVYEISANSDTTAGAFFKWQPFVQGKLKYCKNSLSEQNTFNNDNGLVTQYIAVEENSKITFNPGSEWGNTIELLLYYNMDNIRRNKIAKGSTMTLPKGVQYIRVNKWNNFTNVPATININGKDYILEHDEDKECINTLYKDSTGNSNTEIDYYKSDFRCLYPPTRVAGNDNFAEIKRLVEWVDDASDEDFRDNLDQYFNREYLIRYYIFAMLFGAVDSLGKNMKLASWDGLIWYPQVYDADTTIGLDNTGFLKFENDIEVGDKGVYNTTSSRLWSKLKLLLDAEIKSEYAKMRLENFTLENVLKYVVTNQIHKIPATFYNKDMQTKYLNFGSSYLYALHGSGEQQIKNWLKGRFIYLDTLMQYNVSTSDYVTIRSSKLGEVYLDIQTFTPMYLTVKWRNTSDNSATQVLRVKKGETIRFSFDMPTGTDQEIRIYGGQYIKSLGDLTNLQPTTILMANASNVTELICHSTNLINTDLSECRNLKRVDLSGCTKLGGGVGSQPILNVSKCNNIEYINTDNTLITSVLLPIGCSTIQEIWYSDNVQEIFLSDCINLKTLGLKYGHKCKSLKLVNCPSVLHFGDRKWQPTTQSYTYPNDYFLKGVELLHLDNSYLHSGSDILSFKYGCPKLQNVTLKNHNFKTIQLSWSENLGAKSEGGLDVITMANNSVIYYKHSIIENAPNLTLVDDGQIEKVIVTAREGTNHPNNAAHISLLVNNFDLTGLTNLKSFICEMSILANNINLPLTVKDLQINIVAINSTPSSIYDSLNKDYLRDWVATNIWDSSPRYKSVYNSNLIYSITTPLSKDRVSQCEHRYVYDLEGLNLEKFCLYGFNSPVSANGYHYSQVKFLEDFKVDFRNINAKFTDTLMPFQEYWIKSVENCRLDYSEFTGEGLSYAFCQLNSNLNEVIFPNNLSKIRHFKNVLKSATLPQLKWNDELTITYMNKVSGFNDLQDLNLAPQTSYEEEGIVINNPNITGRHYVEKGIFKGCNLKYIKELNLPNVTELSNILKDNNSPITEIGKLILPKCTNLRVAFADCNTLTRMEYIEVTNTPGSACSLEYTFSNCPSVSGKLKIVGRISNLLGGFANCGFDSIDMEDALLVNCNVNNAFKNINLQGTLTLNGTGTSAQEMFRSSSITTLDLSNFSIEGKNYVNNAFREFKTKGDIIFKGICAEAKELFRGATFRSIDIDELQINGSVEYMFADCKNLSGIMVQRLLKDWDTRCSITNLNNLCTGATFVDGFEYITITPNSHKAGVSNILKNTNVQNIIYDFTTVDVNLYPTNNDFSGCTDLKTITLKLSKKFYNTYDFNNKVGNTATQPFISNLSGGFKELIFDTTLLEEGSMRPFGWSLSGDKTIKLTNYPIHILTTLEMAWYSNSIILDGSTFVGKTRVKSGFIPAHYFRATYNVTKDLFLNHFDDVTDDPDSDYTVCLPPKYYVIDEDKNIKNEVNFSKEDIAEMTTHLNTLGWIVLRGA